LVAEKYTRIREAVKGAADSLPRKPRCMVTRRNVSSWTTDLIERRDEECAEPGFWHRPPGICRRRRKEMDLEIAESERKDTTDFIEKMIGEILQADQLNWLELLDGACMAASSAPLSMTPPRSPFEIETSFAMRVPIDSQPLMDQTFQNRGEGQLVRETMVYSDDGELLDKAPYPGVYEYSSQQQYFYDNMSLYALSASSAVYRSGPVI
jgi:hypothetical protein